MKQKTHTTFVEWAGPYVHLLATNNLSKINCWNMSWVDDAEEEEEKHMCESERKKRQGLLRKKKATVLLKHGTSNNRTFYSMSAMFLCNFADAWKSRFMDKGLEDLQCSIILLVLSKCVAHYTAKKSRTFIYLTGMRRYKYVNNSSPSLQA
ncbi:hypothetical protein PHYBLDRAFT_69834 [Phycomyces blakesleeanus NRRL 1555(-)]|uniref:Uncharacterized protein n=1 Tax=Phycomyces blakesleeanus (strain ATCC 8743b / DSM 1359 / FGSC 10004 / NBRC 33097 / NRRL 1555) TaxID=763407 RepID=A0A162YKK6_PHYB8|nr:hypothetical protein PHYBLDRAFT_69834 [Phycomyces blakesleeanus NRRL 1555(-)]OAD81335.1 hypothetical protein PHYBLDRAFT_69834 [Phycomyces blakesleeanus NRRL 1555(-)]|eukprot:XP_018299375.1 hypothetical protein PHYBLDRAFT_69834 [Phycomyces blakesleeanus NRRL 1555(-)]